MTLKYSEDTTARIAEAVQKVVMDTASKCPRVAVTGGPGALKTTSCLGIMDRLVVHTDDHIEGGWSGAKTRVKDAAEAAGESFVVEGVMVPRALRAGMVVDAVVFISGSAEDLSVRQDGLLKGVRTVFDDWLSSVDTCPKIVHVEIRDIMEQVTAEIGC